MPRLKHPEKRRMEILDMHIAKENVLQHDIQFATIEKDKGGDCCGDQKFKCCRARGTEC